MKTGNNRNKDLDTGATELTATGTDPKVLENMYTTEIVVKVDGGLQRSDAWMKDLCAGRTIVDELGAFQVSQTSNTMKEVAKRSLPMKGQETNHNTYDEARASQWIQLEETRAEKNQIESDLLGHTLKNI